MPRNQSEGSKSMHKIKTSLVAEYTVLLMSTSKGEHSPSPGPGETFLKSMHHMVLGPLHFSGLPPWHFWSRAQLAIALFSSSPYFRDVINAFFSYFVYDYSIYRLFWNLRSPQSPSFIYLDEDPWGSWWENKNFNLLYTISVQQRSTLTAWIYVLKNRTSWPKTNERQTSFYMYVSIHGSLVYIFLFFKR